MGDGSAERRDDSTPGSPRPDRRAGATPLKLIGLAALIGIPAALVASVFLAVVHWSEHWLWTDLPQSLGHDTPPWYLVVGLPVVGALIVACARHLLPGDGGHRPLDGLRADTPTPWRHAPGVALAALGTLAFGAILGPEAPLIALGSAVGMVAVSAARVTDERAATVLATAGSFSAVSALFGGPLVAGFLLLESGLAAGAALMPALLPGLAAAAVGYLLFVGLGDWGGLDAVGITVPDLPTYEGTRLLDLALAVVVGVVVALLVHQVKALAGVIDRVAAASPRQSVIALLLGGLGVGLLAQGAQWLGADHDQVLFSGQSAIPSLLAETSIGVIVLTMTAKALGYAICLGCGFRGGPVFPAIFIGVAVAGVAGLLFDASITWALMVGTAAGMTATSGLVFSSLLFALMLGGVANQDAVPAAVLAVIAAWLTIAALRPASGADVSPGSAAP